MVNVVRSYISYYVGYKMTKKWYFNQKDGQCTYYVTLRRIRVTMIAVQMQQVLHIPSVCL